jgi:hypothetical protein
LRKTEDIRAVWGQKEPGCEEGADGQDGGEMREMTRKG